MNEFYPIGTQGKKWGEIEKKQWLNKIRPMRSYQDEVVTKIVELADCFLVDQYGLIQYQNKSYPLYVLKTLQWDPSKPTVLITGGVHGYETSGVQGALLFVKEQSERYQTEFNFLVVPCVSPWAYEVINRWNALAIDPNRSFYPESPAPEAAALLKLVEKYNDTILVHFDLHETTDSDESEFRRALAARDGTDYLQGEIPDGFYTVADSNNPQADFQQAVIQSVSKVTHIAEPDEDGNIIGSTVMQHGVIHYPMKQLGLCGGITNSRFSTTTEVYPDSDGVTNDECNRAQVAAIVGGLDFIINQRD
ncbi:M14 family metallocarboxypeptidase [Vibrio sp. TH_r3]|uniref:M14 family metallopeptidase n=1 Tax=Vibrio sp. TH_r3 TaxID=3082084 RepID=UPI002952D0C3|nr:M14 family metallocarboxypeptidase [Vibrio sp. TH_r3]MDV7103398.1 M14 family metallocarboxypeptidase [Vibrio sp. TH_r3]